MSRNKRKILRIIIITLTGENGILTQAKAAKERTEIEEITEKIKTEIMGVQAENKGKISEGEIDTILAKYGVVTVEGEEKVLPTSKGYVINLSDIYAGITTGKVEDEVIKVPEEYVESYDISVDYDGSIMAYIVELEEQPGKYELLLIGEGEIYHHGYYGRPEYEDYPENIVSAKISEGITHLGIETFARCVNLREIKIPDSVIDLGSSTFWDCSNLSSIDISDNVTSIRYGVFMGCTSLSSIDIPDNVTIIDMWTFSECTSLISIDIPDNVIEIKNNAFEGCTSLSSINIPKNVTSIGSNVFYDCTNLTSIVIKKEEGSIEGAPWGATNATVRWEP